MSKIRVQSTVFSYQCTLVRQQVLISRDYRIAIGRTGEELAHALSKSSCSDMDKCPISTHHGAGISYDWSKCAFKNKA